MPGMVLWMRINQQLITIYNVRETNKGRDRP